MADGIVGKISVGDGATFTPHVDANGILTFTNNKNLPNPDPFDIPAKVLELGPSVLGLAPLESPAFAGTPTAPTPSASDNSTKLANTAWVKGNPDVMRYIGRNVTNSANDDTRAFWESKGNCTSFFSATGKLKGQPATYGFLINWVSGSEVSQLFYATTQGKYYFRGAAGSATDMPSTWKQLANAEDVLPLAGGTMTGSILVQTSQSSANYGVVRPDIEKGTAPSVIKYSDMSVLMANGITQQHRLALIEHTYNTDNSAFLAFRLYKNQAGSTASTALLIGQRSDLSFYTNVNSDFLPNYDGSYNLGNANYRWKQLFAMTTTISTSDERMKDNIASIPDAVLDAWGDVNWYQYQFKDSIEEKGENARLHTGAIAQRIESIFNAHGLDATRYGLLCYDEWKAESEQRDRDGNIVQPACPAGNRYSLRYEEALCMEAAYQRRRADRLEQRIEALERMMNNANG